MPYRWTHLRKVDQNGGSVVSGDWPISLFRAALFDAEETIQGSPFASAWLRLFQEHLSTSESDMLRWRGEFGTSSEVRRAFSGLYERYFARALLAGELGITDFIPLQTNCTRNRRVRDGAACQGRRYPGLDRLGSAGTGPCAGRSQGPVERKSAGISDRGAKLHRCGQGPICASRSRARDDIRLGERDVEHTGERTNGMVVGEWHRLG